MSSRYETTAHNRLMRVLGQLNDIYRWAETCHYTSEKVTRLVCERVYDSPDYKRLTRWGRGYIAGVLDIERNKIWHDKVEFKYLINGVYVNTKTAKDVDYSAVDTRTGAFFWRGTDKYFTLPEVMPETTAAAA